MIQSMEKFIEIKEDKNNVQIRLLESDSSQEVLAPYSEYFAIFSNQHSQRKEIKRNYILAH